MLFMPNVPTIGVKKQIAGAVCNARTAFLGIDGTIRDSQGRVCQKVDTTESTKMPLTGFILCKRKLQDK